MTDWPTISLDERTARLEDAMRQVGGAVESQGRTQAVLKFGGNPVNHVLHALLSIFTCGLWLLVWAILGMTTKPARYVTVMVDEYGRAWTSAGPTAGWVELHNA